MAWVLTSYPIDRTRLARIADCLAIAVAVSLPWSTSATGILLVAWLLLLIPTLRWTDVRAEIMTAAGGLPVLLVALGLAGMLWADVSWAERFGGIGSFIKLLAIPLLFVQFRRSDRGLWVFGGYVASCVTLLAVSTLAQFVPGFSFIPMHWDHVVVKNAATQSGEFVTCIFGLLYLAIDVFERRRWAWAAGLLVAVLAMLTNILYVATGRTALVIIPVLLVILALKKLNARGMMVFFTAAILVACIGWFSSPYLRYRTIQLWTDYQRYEVSDARNSSGERVEFWKKSIEFVRAAPLIGHGTGSIHQLFIESSLGKSGAAGVASSNPHNQTLAVAIQLGFVGAAVLWAMWVTHFLLFRGNGLTEWVGLVIVVQNIIGSLFNSHLFDFGQGWVYVVGVGVAGGITLGNRALEAAAGGPARLNKPNRAPSSGPF
jgi:O-antigen ligase